MTASFDSRLLDALGDLACAAGGRIMALYGGAADWKPDGSPVTAADHAAEEVILDGLARLMPGEPVLAEECVAAGRYPQAAGRYVCVDPLDGTREFLAGNGEFVVSIGVVERGAAVAGVLYAPALKRLYLGAGARAEAMTVDPGQSIDAARDRAPIHARPWPAGGGLALVSRSHPDPAVTRWLDARAIARREPLGSALKFARIAEGRADVTCRFAPIAEWDVVGGHAILTAAGGGMARPDGGAITYGGSLTGFQTAAYVAWGASVPAEVAHPAR